MSLTVSKSSALRLALQSAHTMGWAIAGIAFSLASGIVTARMLGPGDRGTLAITLTVVGIGTLICGIGTNVALRVYLPSDSRVTISTFRRLSYKLGVVSLLVLLPAMLLLSRPVDRDLADPLVLLCIGLLTISAFFSNQMLDCFNALHQSAQSAQLNAVGSFLTAVLLGTCWLVGFGLIAALLAYACGFALRTTIGLLLLSRLPISGDRPSQPGGERLLLTKGAPLLGVNVGQAIMLRADQLLVGVLMGNHAAGIYSVAITPAGILTVMSNSIGQVTFAEAAYGKLTRQLLVRQTVLALLATAGVATAGVLLTPWLLPLFFGTEFTSSIRVAQLLLIAQVFLAPYLVLSRAATGYGMVKWAGSSGMLGAALIVASAMILVPRFGLIGASFACIITFSTMTAIIGAGLLMRRPWRSAAEENC